MDAPSPAVSICMPHLNSGRFVHDRMQSIVWQTLSDWELVIVDSQSDDGSLETLQRFAATDSRILLHQAPRDGIYSNINRAIERARGRFVYLATSDDTMTPDCLELMVAALERHPECGLVHCRLSIIDSDGRPVPAPDAWENYESQRYFGDWMWKTHVRNAPHDGLLHFRFPTVYTSLTQILVRRDVYRRIGLFRTDCGSYADFAWGMRAGLVENVLHLPEALATWRRHDRQATTADALVRARAAGEFVRIASETIDWLDSVGQQELAARLRERRVLRHYLSDELEARVWLVSSGQSRLWLWGGFLMRHPVFGLARAWDRLVRVFRGRRSLSIGDDIGLLMPGGGLVDAWASALQQTHPRQTARPTSLS